MRLSPCIAMPNISCLYSHQRTPLTRVMLCRWLCISVLLLANTACHGLSHDDSSAINSEDTSTSIWPWQWHWGSDPDPKEVKRQRKIDFLLAKGDLAFRKDRLNTPERDNALLYYYTALRIDPSNANARDGLNNVAKRFRSLSLTAHNNGNEKLAHRYLQQAEMVSGASDPANLKLRDTLQETPSGQKQRALDKRLQQQYKSQREVLKEKQREWQNRIKQQRDANSTSTPAAKPEDTSENP